MAGSIRSFFRWSTAVAVMAAGVAWSSGTATAAGSSSVSINFDDVTAPCTFGDTTPLTTAYASQGVVFKGPSKTDGGAILNECADLGVSGYSAPNFLAFDVAGSYGGGGVPRGPERITFTAGLMSHVQIKAGSADGAKFVLRAYDSGGRLIGSIRFKLTNALKTGIIEAPGIKYVTLSSKSPDWMVDDLSAH